MVDAAIIPGWTNPCVTSPNGGADGSLGPRPYGSFVQTLSGDSDDPVLITAERRVRYLLLDRGDGQPLVIDVNARDKATWDAAVADAMPVVESFEFTR